MRMSYKKLWIRLAEKEVEKSDFRKALGFSPNTMTKLNKNEEVALSILLRICDYLKCNIGEICDAVPSDEISTE